MTHEVMASWRDEQALLRCAICRSETTVKEGEFELLNRFIHEHKACVDTAV
jgi:hypothetical protein